MAHRSRYQGMGQARQSARVLMRGRDARYRRPYERSVPMDIPGRSVLLWWAPIGFWGILPVSE